MFLITYQAQVGIVGVAGSWASWERGLPARERFVAGETSSPWHFAAATCRTLKGAKSSKNIDSLRSWECGRVRGLKVRFQEVDGPHSRAVWSARMESFGDRPERKAVAQQRTLSTSTTPAASDVGIEDGASWGQLRRSAVMSLAPSRVAGWIVRDRATGHVIAVGERAIGIQEAARTSSDETWELAYSTFDRWPVVLSPCSVCGGTGKFGIVGRESPPGIVHEQATGTC